MDEMSRVAVNAEKYGFSHAGVLRAESLRLRSEVRDMCSADKCQMYGKSWMCPPACGSLEENTQKITPYKAGIIVQTTGQLEDDYDYEGMTEAGRLQKERFFAFGDILRKNYPDMLALSSGGCELCKACTYPDAPCRHPESATPSMEAFGLLVSDVCKSNGMGYYYGPQTITYSACYLLV